MRHRDIPECARIVATHPALGPKYGDTIKDLPGVWRRLLDGEWFSMTAVFEEIQGTRVRTHGVGISVFVTDDFLLDAKTPPFFWLAPEITRRVAQGRSPLLTLKQVSETNSREGLNLVVWQIGVDPEDVKRHESMVTGANAFIELHRGFRLNEMVVQGETPEHLAGILNFGALLFRSTEGCYMDSPEENLDRIFEQPHLAGLTREAATRQKGSWLGSLFLYQPPRLGFSRSEQQLLLAARDGKTDEELSDSLSVSLSAVKKAWRAIYARVTEQLPELIPSQAFEATLTLDRGKEKKRRLLAYLREHPEELRPISRKLLQARSADPGILPNRKSSPRQSSLLIESRII
jgi:hypothetical protein